MENNAVIDNFVFVIVEQDEDILRSTELKLKERGITPICISYENLQQVSDTVKDIHLRGVHNYENVCAAIAATASLEKSSVVD